MTPDSELDLEHSCPFLGTDFDHSVHFGYPTHDNVCFASGRSDGVEIDHQDAYCLSQHHRACPLYQKAAAARMPAAAALQDQTDAEPFISAALRYLVLGVGIVAAALAIVWFWPQIRDLVTPPSVAFVPTNALTPTPTPTQFIVQANGGAAASPTLAVQTTTAPTATATATTTPSPSVTPTPSATATATPAPTDTPTPRPTARPPTAVPTRRPTATPVAVDRAPILRSPASGFLTTGLVSFSWDWPGAPLSANQGFEVRVWKDGQPDHFGASSPVTANAATIDLRGAYGVQQGGNGRYFWTVALVQVNPYKRIGPEASARVLTVELAGEGPTPAPTLPP